MPAAVIPPPAPAKTVEAGGAGKSTYDTTCAACHGTGVAGAPKFGDKGAWAPRVAAGKPALYASARKGKGAMPPKGGNAALPDDAIKAAVDYMVAAAK
jgi:cytochrome c5